MMHRIIILGLMLGIVAGCAGSGSPRANTSTTLQNYLNYAGPPIDHFPAMGGIANWSAVDNTHVVLHTRNNKAYLITIFQNCPDLRSAHGIQVDSSMSSSVHRMDKIVVGRDTCLISQIRQIAIQQMKADKAAARADAAPKQ